MVWRHRWWNIVYFRRAPVRRSPAERPSYRKAVLSEAPNIRIMVVDDHPVVCFGLLGIIANLRRGYDRCGGSAQRESRLLVISRASS